MAPDDGSRRSGKKKNRIGNESLRGDSSRPRTCISCRVCINFAPLSPAGTCVFMRHSEAYKRRAISDTIKMCISRRCFKRNPGPGASNRNSASSPDAKPRAYSTGRAYFTYARNVLFPYSASLLYLPEEIIIRFVPGPALILALSCQLIPLFTILHGTPRPRVSPYTHPRQPRLTIRDARYPLIFR